MSRPVLRAGNEIDARVRCGRRVGLAVFGSVNQRNAAAPVFVRTVGVKNLGHRIGLYGAGQERVRQASIGVRLVGEVVRRDDPVRNRRLSGNLSTIPGALV